ncbi:palmitoyl-acyl carrier protein thioesterase, chloroplastic isoform X2 [Elaeis guineensis]|uniref:palmitoyl-acyl carrier protein thioesterase, chloroplastic isoform X2 n=1 Tax=Elaeis guineensis var. tenera TaxID=51953 RepID=UPI003C6D3495
MMATTARSSSISLCLRRWEAGKIEGVPKVGVVVGWARKREVRGLCVKGDGDGYQVSVDTVNGRKVNGVVHGSDASLYVGRGMGLGAEDGGGMVSVDSFKLGRFVEDRFVYRQAFVIRSYEIGPDETATMETLMNLLQETALNHVMSSGLASDGFGATHEMNLRKLIWVVTRINIQVDKYSRWGDVVEIDTWVAASGKNGMRRDWIIRDYNTKRIIARATSKWVMMNRETRMLSKIPEQVKEEVRPFYLDRKVIHESSEDKIDKLTDETAENIISAKMERYGCQSACEQCQIYRVDLGVHHWGKVRHSDLQGGISTIFLKGEQYIYRRNICCYFC